MKKDICVLRIMATLAVVFMHSCNSMTANAELFSVSGRQYVFFACCTTAMMWAVPAFYMITGELLLSSNKEYSFGYMLSHNVRRMFLALLLFGVPFSLMEFVAENNKLDIKYVYQAFLSIVNGQSWDHLWYLYSIIGIYLVIPIFKRALERFDKKEIISLIVLLYVFDILMPYLDLLIGTTIYFKIPIVGYALLYVLLGYFISKYEIARYIKREVLLITIIALTIILILLCIICKDSFLKYVGYDSPITVVHSALLFILSKQISTSKLSKDSIIWKIDRLCFGVYLIHPFFINLIYKVVHIYPAKSNFYYFTIFMFWMVFAGASFATSFILNKIRIISKYVL